jgi:hypothetical protein
MDERTIKLLGRNYFRLIQGGSIVGAPIGWLFNSAEIYGIFRPFIQEYTPWLTLGPFAVGGSFLIFLVVFGVGFICERSGLFKAMQSFLNSENNPEWCKREEQFDRIEKKLDQLLEGNK